MQRIRKLAQVKQYYSSECPRKYRYDERVVQSLPDNGDWVWDTITDKIFIGIKENNDSRKLMKKN